MFKKTGIVVFTIILISWCTLSAQDSHCNVPEKIVDGKLAVEVLDNKLIAGSNGTVLTYFKMAAKSNEVNEADWINCDGFMPNGAKISSIEILSIEGLPKGLNWQCDKENCLYEGGTTGCVTIKGTALEKGTYPLTIITKGVGKLFGIKKSYNCLMKNLELVVE